MPTDYSNYNARTYHSYSKIWQSTGKCVFCDLKEKYIVREEDGVVLTANLFPYIDGHLLIIPERHIEQFDEANKNEWEAIKYLSEFGRNLLKEKLKIENVWFMYRMVEGFKAGKTVAHAHAHLVPYSEKLFKFEYQKITVAPEELAKVLRNSSTINSHK